MATLRLWPATDGPASPSADPVDYTLGTEFEVTEACDFTAWHWWCQTNATVSFGLYRVDSAASGTLLASVAGVAVVAGGWRRTAAAAPVALTPGLRYRAVVFSTTDGFYCTTPNYWSSGGGAAGIVNGALEAPNAAGATGLDQGSFTASVGVMTFPTDSFNATNYWIDPEVETASANFPATGTVDVLTATGGAPTADHAATGTVGVLTAAQGASTADHAATGTVAVTSTVSGAPQLTSSGGGSMLITDQCGWDAEPCECSALDTLRVEQPTLAAAVEAMAARHLFRWTGSRYAPCPVTVRPCRTDCRSAGQVLNFGGAYGHPVLWPGFGCACGGQDSCSCNNVCQIELTGPLLAVDEVWIDGVLLPSTAYRVDNAKYLVRTDGECWPECNDLSKPYMVEGGGPGNEAVLGTWAVTYRHGLPIPAGGPQTAGMLACEIAKAICNDKACALPTRVREISREGVTIAMLDDFTGLAEGMTGIWVIDSWIMTNRPGRPSKFSVWSPETRERGRSQTWP